MKSSPHWICCSQGFDEVLVAKVTASVEIAEAELKDRIEREVEEMAA